RTFISRCCGSCCRGHCFQAVSPSWWNGDSARDGDTALKQCPLLRLLLVRWGHCLKAVSPKQCPLSPPKIIPQRQHRERCQRDQHPARHAEAEEGPVDLGAIAGA